MRSTADSVRILAAHGHSVIDAGGLILARAEAGRLSDAELEDLLWRSVAAHLAAAKDPSDELARHKLEEISRLCAEYMAYRRRRPFHPSDPVT